MEIGSKNLQLNITDTVGVTLVAGTYTAGQIIVEDAVTQTWSYAAVSDTTRALVLLSDVDTAIDGDSAIGAEGTFNVNIVTSAGAIDSAVLQKKNIVLKTNIKK